MVINKLSLRNFKCYESVDIDFSKITLLTGANSSGKSSLINSILGIMQSPEFPFAYSLNGEYINMGSYDEVVFMGETEREIEIDLNLEINDSGGLSYCLFTKYTKTKLNNLPEFISCTIDDNNDNPFVVKVNKDNEQLIVNFIIKNDLNEFYDLEAIQHITNALKSIEMDMKTYGGNVISEQAGIKCTFDLKRTPIQKHFTRIFRNIQYYLGFNFLTEMNLNMVTKYLGSFREQPERTYYKNSNLTKTISQSGNGYIDQIISWEENTSPEYSKLNQIVQELGLLENIHSKSLDGGRFELRVKTSGTELSSALSDVGFGVSQFLPIIVADLQLGEDSLLMVSQPEIHLHPKVQAQYGNYLAGQVSRKNKQYIIETHSEYLLNRLRLLITKGELPESDVAVYYMENDNNGTKTYTVKFHKDGRITGAPASFFDTYMMDVLDIAMNAE